MAEFTYPERQTVQSGQSALLNNTTCGCNKGYISHMDGFGGITIKGVVNNPCANFARYLIKYTCNIALSEGSTVGPIQVALTLNGETMQDTIAIVTPAAVGDFWNVSGFKTLDIPKGCCPMVAVDNVSADNTSVDFQNLNVAVNRTA